MRVYNLCLRYGNEQAMKCDAETLVINTDKAIKNNN